MKGLAPLLAALTLVASPAAAQTWPVGEVKPEWSNRVQWSPPIAPDDPHPADRYEPPVSEHDNVLYDREAWMNDENRRTKVGTSGEAKFRTPCAPSFIKRADPLLYPGQYPAGHNHTFFGPTDPYVIENVQDFSYEMARAHPGSSCPGGPLNSTLYWEPSVQREVDGAILTVMPEAASFYYTHDADEAAITTRIRRDYRFIGGANPINYNDTERRREYAKAGLLYPGSADTPAGFGGVQCHPGDYNGSRPAAEVLPQHRLKRIDGYPEPRIARYLVGPDGSDPWGGACTSGIIIVKVRAQECWDGTNLTSPDGRSHVRYSTRHEWSTVKRQCPKNYVKIMHFEAAVSFVHNGWQADLQHWYMASDRMDPAMTVTSGCKNDPATQGDKCSLDPCRKTGPYFCAFSTAHFDWWNGWDDEVMAEWQRNCGGLTVYGITTELADCQTGGTDTSRGLVYGGPPPAPGLSSDPVNSRPKDWLNDSVEGRRYFQLRPEDHAPPPATTQDVHH
jgi:hypothetical protein